jgi:hypothetical protein
MLALRFGTGGDMRAAPICLAVLLLAMSGHVAMAQMTIGNGLYSVDVAATGVLIAVPSSGLHTIDGRRVDLAGACAEWYGLSFRIGGTLTVASGSGLIPDWAHRPPVEIVWWGATGDRATCVTRAGPLVVTTYFQFDPRMPFLLVAATLTNTGSTTLNDIRYSREWLDAGPPGPDALDNGVVRREWRLDDLRPGTSGGIGLSWSPEMPPPTTFDVPLHFWTNADFPNGLPVGATNGVTLGDYDADGFVDMFACQSANLWHNLGGNTWQFARDLDGILPPVTIRYSASFGDYDDDGLPDIATEPRRVGMQDSCFHLLKNLGGGPNFVDVATNPALVIGQPCGIDSETLCWADVDGDGELDVFQPTYPPWAIFPGPGNKFLHNLGPVGPGGAHVMKEMVDEVGLANPPDTERPEGAQFCDVDLDGDIDLFSNGTIYQNRSRVGVPMFAALEQAGSGIGFRGSLDEGAAFFDYDLDGDYDLVVAYVDGTIGVVLWENQGDGTFFQATDPDLIESPFIGLGIGLSTADWDGDGDIDFTTRGVFRRNMIRETGARGFVLAQGQIPGTHLTSATPAWGDWDHDGDLDCALGNYLHDGTFYENTLNDTVPPSQRAYVRVRPVRDAVGVPRGLETEYGATVAVALPGEMIPRKQFTAASHGMLNENEYDLTFGLIGAPSPTGLPSGIRFGISSTFPSVPGGQLWVVDPLVSPVLGGLQLGALSDREVTVFRSGRVRVNSCEFAPPASTAPTVIVTTRGLALPDVSTSLPAPAPAPQPDFFVGLDFDTMGATGRLRVTGLVLDGQLDGVVSCEGKEGNVLLWDVTSSEAPVLARHGVLALATSPRNHRTHLPVQLTLDPDRRYRLVARMTSSRESAVTGPVTPDPVHVHGGLAFRDDDPCSGSAVASALVAPQRVPLAIEYHRDALAPWHDLGFGLAGALGTPVLTGSGDPIVDAPVQLALTGARPLAPVSLIVGTGAGCQPYQGGRLIPLPEFRIDNLATNATGSLVLNGTWPELPPATSVFYQMWITDPTGPKGFTASNAIAGTTW